MSNKEIQKKRGRPRKNQDMTILEKDNQLTVVDHNPANALNEALIQRISQIIKSKSFDLERITIEWKGKDIFIHKYYH